MKANKILSFLKSFKYAFYGLKRMSFGQTNFYVQLLAMVFALTLAYILPLLNHERAIIVLVIAVVLSAEIFNTAIEKIADWIDSEYNEKAAEVKDLAAAAVLVLSIAAVIIAAIIFIPYLV